MHKKVVNRNCQNYRTVQRTLSTTNTLTLRKNKCTDKVNHQRTVHYSSSLTKSHAGVKPRSKSG